MKTKTNDEHPYIKTLNERFRGKLAEGAHEPDGVACALEAASVARGKEWSDDPGDLPDIRMMNDACSDDETRTRLMVPIVLAYWDWGTWPEARKRRVMARVAELTIRRVLPLALRGIGLLPEADRCEREGTAESARATVSAESAARAISAARATARAMSATVSAASVAESAARAVSAAESAARATRATVSAAGVAESAARYKKMSDSTAERTKILEIASALWVESAATV